MISIFCVCAYVVALAASVIELPADLLQSSNSTATKLLSHNDMDRYWTTVSLIEQKGYPTEVHRVVTQDGYVLKLHRLPQPGHQPVLLVHGLYGSAMDFVIMERNVSLGFLLWDHHYDVWLANCRGSSSSQQHIHYTRKDLAFWNFSFHDVGFYDLPAIIEYIRSNSSFHHMHYVGHSQGATALLVLASERPEYNEKLAKVQLMAPLAYFGNVKVEQSYLDIIEEFLKEPASRGIHEFMPRDFLRHMNCLKNKFLRFSCLQMIFEIIGQDLEQFDQTKLDLIFNQMPAGGSVKQLRHFFQMRSSGAFQHYNYGFEGNYDKYAEPSAPAYNLFNVNVSLYIYYGPNDRLANEKDVQLLYKQLTCGKDLFRVEHSNFNHMDFIWSKNLRTLVNDKILEVFGSDSSDLQITNE